MEEIFPSIKGLTRSVLDSKECPKNCFQINNIIGFIKNDSLKLNYLN